MRMMTMGLRSLISLAVLLASTSSVEARSLVNKLDNLFGTGITLQTNAGHTAHFSSASASALGALVGQLAGNAADFTAISTTPGFTYRFNPDLDVFERAPGGLASVFVDVPQTIGKGRFDVGVAYQYVDFDKLDGADLDGLTIELGHQDVTGDNAFENDVIDLVFDKFTLRSHVISTFGTYGITDRWDVNMVVPIVLTSLDVNARAVIEDVSGQDVHHFDDGGIVESSHTDGDKLGVGDILLRTKYRFTDNPGFNVASGLVFRLPTGDQNDFQGFGDFTLTPLFVGGYSLGPHNFHLNAGIEIDPEDLERSRARYSIGASIQIIERLAFLTDVIGSSGLANEEITVDVPRFDTSGNPTGETVPETTEFRTDIVDLALGLKANPFGTMVAFAGVIIPLNDDGLRPDIVPTGGVEVTF